MEEEKYEDFNPQDFMMMMEDDEVFEEGNPYDDYSRNVQEQGWDQKK